ncbi:hypothetical protein J6590_029922 [Homalodisca vitripennis]|nr:hypothetical protein J6590_029922 [Homalodisca vitripennis]
MLQISVTCCLLAAALAAPQGRRYLPAAGGYGGRNANSIVQASALPRRFSVSKPASSQYGGSGGQSQYGGGQSQYGGGQSQYGGGQSQYGGGQSQYGGGNKYGGGNQYGGGASQYGFQDAYAVSRLLSTEFGGFSLNSVRTRIIGSEIKWNTVYEINTWFGGFVRRVNFSVELYLYIEHGKHWSIGSLYFSLSKSDPESG